jgi:hypothetical protein
MINNGKTVATLFTENNISKDEILTAIYGPYGDKCYSAVNKLWNVKLGLLKDDTIRWFYGIIETCQLAKEPRINGRRYIKTGESRFKKVTKEDVDFAEKYTSELKNYYKENVKITRIDPVTKEETIINDPEWPIDRTTCDD